jgi:hypothetical protein
VNQGVARCGAAFGWSEWEAEQGVAFMTGAEIAETIEVQLLRPGYVFQDVVRGVGDRVAVTREEFGRLRAMGFVRERIRVRALVPDRLAGNRVLAVGEEGEAASESLAIEGHLIGIWDITNPQALSSGLPPRPNRRRVKVRVTAANGFRNGDVEEQTRSAIIYGPGDTCEVEAWQIPGLVRNKIVERVKEKHDQPAPAQRIKVRAAEPGQYGTRLLSVGELAELDLETAIGPLSEGRLVRVQEEPAGGDSGSAFEGKSKKPK